MLSARRRRHLVPPAQGCLAISGSTLVLRFVVTIIH
jgi:hypothetical protein